jgi:hypothetical protein
VVSWNTLLLYGYHGVRGLHAYGKSIDRMYRIELEQMSMNVTIWVLEGKVFILVATCAIDGNQNISTHFMSELH